MPEEWEFSILSDFITAAEEKALVKNVMCALDITPQDKLENHGEEGRSRVLRYGYAYRSEQVWLGQIPDWLTDISTRIACVSQRPAFNSVTLNEYFPGSGIVPHIDSPDFDEVISILNLNSHCTMILTSPHKKVVGQFIPPRSVTVLAGDARSLWTHEIKPVKFDMVDGRKMMRGVRYSIVFRNRILTG